ncbi:hypothetical protein N2152v2_009707 [Parachlorella kessleri]
MSRELKMLQTDPPPGVWAGPKGDSITALEAQIQVTRSMPLHPSSRRTQEEISSVWLLQGPIGTVYDGGVFSLEVNIPARYPFEPPKVRFVTRVYHPNIDGEGRICLDLLNMPPKGAWKPSLNISTVLASIGLLLSDPNPDDGLVADITQEFKHQRQVFDAKARQLTQRYAVHRDGSDHAGSGSDTTAVPGNGGIGGAEEGQERQHDQAMDATAAARVATEGASAWEAVGQQQEHQHEQQQQQGHNDPIRQHMGQCLNEHGQATAARQPDENRYSSKFQVLARMQFFDAAKPSPILTRYLEDKRLNVAGKRVFVPGCGRGYDLVALLAAGAEEAVGLELAPTALLGTMMASSVHVPAGSTGGGGYGPAVGQGRFLVKVAAARDYLASQSVDPSRAQMVQGNYFTWQDAKGPFDVGYDYTFMCALHPDMRADWAAAWSRFLKPGGTLACLVFPVDPERQTGPPWPVTPEIYEDLLSKHGFQCLGLEKVPEELSHPGREGKEFMGE